MDPGDAQVGSHLAFDPAVSLHDVQALGHVEAPEPELEAVDLLPALNGSLGEVDAGVRPGKLAGWLRRSPAPGTGLETPATFGLAGARMSDS